MTDYDRGHGEHGLQQHPTAFIWDISFINLSFPFFLILKYQLISFLNFVLKMEVEIELKTPNQIIKQTEKSSNKFQSLALSGLLIATLCNTFLFC